MIDICHEKQEATLTDHDAAAGPAAGLKPPVGQWLYVLSEDKELDPNGRPRKIFKPVRALKDEEYEKLGNAIQSVTNIIQGFMVYVHQALKDLDESLQGVVSDPSNISGDVNGHRIELEYRMLNVCAAIRMYEEHTFSEIDRKYGPKSSQRTTAKSIFNQTYARSLEYRVLYYLRNAITHGSRNLISFAFNASVDQDGSHALDLRLPLQRLKFSNSNAKATVRQEVRFLPQDPDTLSMCFTVLPVMETMNQQLMPILEPDGMDSVITLAHLINEAAAAGGYPVLGSVDLSFVTPSEQGDPVEVPLSMTLLPERVRDFVATVLNSTHR